MDAAADAADAAADARAAGASEAPKKTCCSCCGAGKGDVDSFAKAKEQGKDISLGPVKERHCTDLLCLLIFIVAWVFFVGIVCIGIPDANLNKLYSPMDFSGAVCGAEENWNSDLNLQSATKLAYTMNVSYTVDVIAMQFMCSTAASAILANELSTDDYTTYRCECCLSQCSKCSGSFELGGDLSTDTELNATITSRITALTTNSIASLYDSTGSNGDMFTTMWESTTAYMNKVCLSSCDIDYTSTSSLTRTYDWEPAGDNPLKFAWTALASSGNPAATDPMSLFSFNALSLDVCPYESMYCVPFPGVTFSEMDLGDWCELEVGGDVASAVGSAAASTFTSLGQSDIADSATESFGSLVGDLQQTFPATILVCVCSFVIGFVFLVLLRFFVGVCVYIALFGTLVIILMSGGLSYVYSIQCADASLFETGTQVTVAVAAAGASIVDDAINGASGCGEDMTGDGADYCGKQAVTKLGKTCQAWSAQTPHAHGFTAENYPDSNLEDNYCRNPYNSSSVNKGETIWCLTTDPLQIWGECLPIGTITSGECESGYAVASETLREVCKVVAYIIWGLAGLWLLLIICKCSSIRDAVAVNKTAALFIMDNPTILALPALQSLCQFLWVCAWIPMAAILLSVVPDDYVPSGWFATYAEAAGTDDTAGACTDSWPTGFTYKDEACVTEDGVVKCWRCAPPRYTITYQSFYAIFMFLWNNAFLIAIGQTIVAGAVCVWFFAPHAEKRKKASVCAATKTVFRYHLGSLAFGSFILAVVQFLRFLAYYLEKQAQAQKNKVMQIIAKIAGCLLACLEKSVKFLNRQAYIQIALMGTNFCTSAWNAFRLILSMPFLMAFTRILSSFVNLIGVMFIMICTTVVGYLIVDGLYPDVSVVVPVFMYAAIGYLVGKLMMNVFTPAVDTSLQCMKAAKEMECDTSQFAPKPIAGRLK